MYCWTNLGLRVSLILSPSVLRHCRLPHVVETRGRGASHASEGGRRQTCPWRLDVAWQVPRARGSWGNLDQTGLDEEEALVFCSYFAGSASEPTASGPGDLSSDGPIRDGLEAGGRRCGGIADEVFRHMSRCLVPRDMMEVLEDWRKRRDEGDGAAWEGRPDNSEHESFRSGAWTIMTKRLSTETALLSR